MGKLNKLTVLCLLAWVSIASTATLAARPLTVQEFIDKMVQVHNYNRDDLVHLFQKIEYLPEVIHRINTPLEKKSWDYYRSFFVTPERISAGVDYWRQHASILDKVAQEYKVSPAVIVAIIGVETRYGQETGKFPELGTLATLSFHYPARAVFFQNELENYLLLTRDYQLPPELLRGSYAGALGIPQFMPSSYRRFAVSSQNQTGVNLLTNHEDAIQSVANYLKKSGWQANQPIALPAQIDGSVKRWLISKDAKPIFQLKRLEKFGVHSSLPNSVNLKSALIAMQKTDGEEYWLVFQNFHAIMSYNPRTNYALSVYQLSEAIRKNYEGSNTKGSTLPTSR